MADLTRLYTKVHKAILDETEAPYEYQNIKDLMRESGNKEFLDRAEDIDSIIRDEIRHRDYIKDLLVSVKHYQRLECRLLVEQDLQEVGRIMARGGTQADAEEYIEKALDKYAFCVKGE